MVITSENGSDSGANPLFVFRSRIGAATAVTVRPLFSWQNGASDVLSLLPLNSGANSALSWGTQSGAVPPAFTTRSSGTRLVLFSDLGASSSDYAIGYGPSGVLWNSISQATSNREFRWYGGTSTIARLFGDGTLQTTGGKIKKYRIALTSPVTIAVTDDIVEVNLTTPGPVVINYPATPEVGREYVVIDGKGDSLVNNHTHTPAAGNINGAATVLAAINYYRSKASYNGTQWLFAKEIP
jgi:hypothetical protein